MAIVYIHRRKDTNEIFYVGIGKKEYRASSKSRDNPYWHHIVKKYGYTIEIIFKDLSWEEACIKEKELIIKYGRKNLNTGTLVNLTDGGEGTLNVGPETLKKISRLGYRHSDEVRKKISESGKLWKRKPLSEEQRKRISERMKGKKVRLGATLLEESKRKMSLSRKKLFENGYINPNKGKKKSEETINKLKESLKGKCLGEKNKNSKLTLEQVKLIRNEYVAFDKIYNQKQLGKKYNVHKNTISAIVNNLIWKTDE
jgi:hypothetical protein